MSFENVSEFTCPKGLCKKKTIFMGCLSRDCHVIRFYFYHEAKIEDGRLSNLFGLENLKTRFSQSVTSGLKVVRTPQSGPLVDDKPFMEDELPRI